ncbi:hypothetical protein J6590_070325 [Homalodisca vitripennis]|nr:hypothetical protein J6590_070325 [Homalodisca vitripennis]
MEERLVVLKLDPSTSSESVSSCHAFLVCLFCNYLNRGEISSPQAWTIDLIKVSIFLSCILTATERKELDSQRGKEDVQWSPANPNTCNPNVG